ncbi:hypothetical protein HOY82DRAFT_610035 [Tuber indicum]|nr:hypothetical protein HOY82DRAFT_610035 [Tuber indicum]
MSSPSPAAVSSKDHAPAYFGSISTIVMAIIGLCIGTLWGQYRKRAKEAPTKTLHTDCETNEAYLEHQLQSVSRRVDSRSQNEGRLDMKRRILSNLQEDNKALDAELLDTRMDNDAMKGQLEGRQEED